MTSAIFYHPEAYSVSGPKLMGRNAAGSSFLQGFIEYSRLGQFYVEVNTHEHAQEFARLTQQYGRTESTRAFLNHVSEPLIEVGNIYFPGPNIKDLAIKRSFTGDHLWSLTGITHTTSSAAAMDAICELLTSPVQMHDALICTSNAVKDNVVTILQHHMEWMRERCGATAFVLPQLPVIPLGIDTRIFQKYRDQRALARQTLQIEDDEVVILYVGRLSFHAKAHPLAMYQALEKAAQYTQQKIVLVECGWFGNEHIEAAFEEAFTQFSPSVRRCVLDGRDKNNQMLAWGSADIFCSLSDNIQETFGITPIEAMACGLPVVVSDWDGYKDTVRHGIDGFRIPTIMPEHDFVGDLAMRHALGIDSYDRYCGHTSSLIAVDVEQTANAFIELIKSQSLRHNLGMQAQDRARNIYDWRHIIPQYEELWMESKRIRDTKEYEAGKGWAARLDPFKAFNAYPTQTLNDNTRLTLVDASLEASIEKMTRIRSLAMVDFASQVLPDYETLVTVLNTVEERRNLVVSEMTKVFDEKKLAIVKRAVVWLVKINVLKVNE